VSCAPNDNEEGMHEGEQKTLHTRTHAPPNLVLDQLIRTARVEGQGWLQQLVFVAAPQ
jgi:hypothetical protein